MATDTKAPRIGVSKRNNPLAAMAADKSATLIAMLVDQSSPDAAILNAYEAIRECKVIGYSLDIQVGDGADEKRDEVQYAAEAAIHKATATTIPGVACRLVEAVSHIDHDRWLDHTLAEFGLLAVLPEKDALDWPTAQLLRAADELVRINWDLALARYARAADTFNAILDIDSLLDRHFPDRPSEIVDFMREAEIRFTDCAAINELIRTLAPDAAALRLKSEIAEREGLSEEAMRWIARDAQFLLGPVLAAQAQVDTKEAA